MQLSCLKNEILKRIACMASAAVLFCADFAFLPTRNSASAETVGDMKTKISELDETKKQLKAKAESLQGEIDKKQAYVDTVNEYTTAVENKIIECEKLLAAYQDEVDKLDSDIYEKNVKLAENKELFKKRVRSIYMSGMNTSMTILLGSNKFADYLSISQFTEGLAKYDKALMEKINLSIEAIEKTKKEKAAAVKKQKKVKQQLADERNELQQQQQIAAEELGEVNKSKQQLDDELDEINSKKSALENKIDAAYEAARQAALKKQQEEEEKRRAEEEKKQREEAETDNNNSENTETESGADGKNEENESDSDNGNSENSVTDKGYIWPLPGYSLITSYFGNRFDPYYQIYRGHKGIDISGGGVAGKPIIATADGTVTVAEFNDGGYGNYVVISHGFKKKKLITSHYGHMVRYAVSVGQTVKQGDVIGYVGTTGASTGYHLHFEMREDNVPVDPFGYVSY